jgi:hypothetical protein
MYARIKAMTPGQQFAFVFGVGYLLSGVASFVFSDALTGGSPDDKLLLFRTNYVHSILHVLVGVVWLAAARSAVTARMVNLVFGTVLLLLAVLGFTGIGLMHTFINVGSSMDPDNFLHLGSGLAAFVFGWAGTERRAESAV